MHHVIYIGLDGQINTANDLPEMADVAVAVQYDDESKQTFVIPKDVKALVFSLAVTKHADSIGRRVAKIIF